MNAQESTKTISTSIHPDTQLGLVALTVADLERSTEFYRDVLGFKVLKESDGQSVLGAGGTPLLVLHELKGAGPAPTNRAGLTGLYHFAILVPTRADLARSLFHMVESGYPLGGASDHLVSEALYLSDQTTTASRYTATARETNGPARTTLYRWRLTRWTCAPL